MPQKKKGTSKFRIILMNIEDNSPFFPKIEMPKILGPPPTRKKIEFSNIYRTSPRIWGSPYFKVECLKSGLIFSIRLMVKVL